MRIVIGERKKKIRIATNGLEWKEKKEEDKRKIGKRGKQGKILSYPKFPTFPAFPFFLKNIRKINRKILSTFYFPTFKLARHASLNPLFKKEVIQISTTSFHILSLFSSFVSSLAACIINCFIKSLKLAPCISNA